METDQTKMTTASAPLAVGLVDDDAERWRRQLYHVPTAAQKANAIEDGRWFNSKKNADEIAACRQYLAVFQENNRHLAAVGLVPLNFPTPPDWRDLNLSELRTHLTVLGRLTREQVDALNRHEAEGAEARFQADLALETPIVRWLVERLEAAEADIAELKAERSGRDRAIAQAEPVRPKAMSGMSIATGSGLCAEVSIPPSAARPDPSAARRITSR